MTEGATSTPAGAATILEPQELARYASAIVDACLGVGEGDVLIVQGEPAHRELAGALAEAAYAAGARLVDVVYVEPRARAARVRHARDEDLGRVPPWTLARARAQLDPRTATVNVVGDTDPDALADLPPARVAADQAATARELRRFSRAVMAGRRRGSVVAWPTPAWALRVYPELDAAEAQRRLGRDLLSFCRLGPGDPSGIEGWRDHAARLATRNRALTELELERLELRGPCTELRIGISPGAQWLGGPRENAFGQVTTPNFPTEENFTGPDARATEGTFRCSRPLSFAGRLLDGLRGEFRSGRLVRLDAARDEDRDLLASYLDADPGARRLGEAALVDRSSRIGQTGRIYYNTLIDENAVAHIAFGAGYEQTRVPDARARGNRGLNRSKIHLDVMIGDDELEATGFTRDGRRVPLVVGGAWQIP